MFSGSVPMFGFLLRNVFHGRTRRIIRASSSYMLFYNNDPSISTLSNSLIRFFATSSQSHSQSFSASYLINNFGFSQESALNLSKHVRFKTPENPDSVISFFEDKGFSETQTKTLVTKCPQIIAFRVKNLSPKLDFFLSRGFSSPDLAKYLTKYPTCLKSSLDKQIAPSFNLLSNLVQSDDKAVKVLLLCPFIIGYDLNSSVIPNFNILLENGVPKSNTINAFCLHPNAFLTKSDYFNEIVKKVKEIGFNPLEFKFVLAVVVLRKNGESNWESKFDVYKKWGLSEKQIWEFFLKYPWVMASSADKIAKTMEFLINTMGIEPSAIAKHGMVIGRSFDKRIVPRGLFVQDLISNGLAIKFTLCSLFDISEQDFLKRFVYQFKDKAPELLKLYKQKVDVAAGGKYKTQRKRSPWRLR